ncbi:MAG: hemolysin family protein [Patescibacteria group bacterium]
MDVFQLFTVVVLLILGGSFAGLTLAFFSLDRAELERKSALGDKRATRILHVRRRGNELLVTLLLGNVAVSSSIAIIFGEMTSGVVAGILSTALILIFGEIIPQAFCARHALSVAARTTWLIEGLMILFYPISKPIAWILDIVLGQSMTTVWSKRELEHIIQTHEDDPRSGVDADEERILLGALRYSDKTAEQVMTKKEDVFAIPLGMTLGSRLIDQIKKEGYTRIPVYEGDKDNVVGVIYVKDLIGRVTGAAVTDLIRTDILVRTTPTRKLDEVLNAMISKHAHMAVVTEKSGRFVGIVTLEDILEEIIGREIHDENDLL